MIKGEEKDRIEHSVLGILSSSQFLLNTEYRVNDWFSVVSGLRYIGKPYNMHEDNSEEGGIDLYRTRNVNHYFEVPLSLRFSLGNDTIRGCLGAGLYLGVRFLSTESGRLNVYDFITTADTNPYFWGTVDLNPVSDNLFDTWLLAEVKLESVTHSVEVSF